VEGKGGVPAAATHEMVHAAAKTVAGTPEMVNAGREMADATAEVPGVPLQPPD